MPLPTKRVIAGALSGLFLLGAGFWLGHVSAQGHEPGSTGDPLVSKSYVDQIATTVRSQMDQTILGLRTYVEATFLTRAQLGAATSNMVTRAQVDERTVFAIVTVPAGKQVIGQASTEIVLRGGQATAVTSASGGLLDVTGGNDIGSGERIPPNHLLVVPRADGRGLLAATDLVLMVKGQVTVEDPPAKQ